MTNTFFEPGTDKVEDMIASISYGFYLENASSGMEDPKNWGIQCLVDIAREIKDGKFTGKVFSLTDRICTGLIKIHFHDVRRVQTRRNRLLWKRTQRVGKSI